MGAASARWSSPPALPIRHFQRRYRILARIWEAASGRQLVALEGHTDTIWAVAWAPGGQQVLTGSEDDTARIWIADNRPIIAELTRRVCNLFTDDTIRDEIPGWRGCVTELAAVDADLKTYDALRGRR